MTKTKKRTQYSFYFDTETYKTPLKDFNNNNYEDLNAYAYAVGVCYHKYLGYKPRRDVLEYHSFIGLNAMEQFRLFLEDFINNKMEKYGRRTIYLYAYNMIYDVKFLVREICDKPGWSIKFETDKEESLILCGYISYNKTRIKFVCLYKWKPNTPLREWIKSSNITLSEFPRVNYREGGEDKTIEIKEKLSIFYDKWDLYEEGGDLYYYTADYKKHKLNLIEEYEYLKIDVLALPRVQKTQRANRVSFSLAPWSVEGSGWDFAKEMNFMGLATNKMTVASVSKLMFDVLIGSAFDDIYRPIIEHANAAFNTENFQNSRIGGFTSGCDITSHEIGEGELIKSYDVNSMYPYIMSIGMPGGVPVYEDNLKKVKGSKLFYEKREDKYVLGGDFVPWILIKVPVGSFIKWRTKTTWNGKKINIPKFDNTILGKTFLKTREGGSFFILKIYWDLLNKLCYHNLKPSPGFYIQKISPEIATFINTFYKLKQKGENHTRAVAKLVLNSMYGKAVQGVYENRIKYGCGKVRKGWSALTEEDFNNSSITRIKDDNPPIRVNLGGIYIVNMARTILIMNILDEVANGNTFLYADTDSIKMIEKKPTQLYTHPDELGAWKDEGTFTNWLYPKKHKRYCAWDKKDPANPDKLLFKLAGLGGNIINSIKKSPEIRSIIMDHTTNVLFLEAKIYNSINNIRRVPVLVSIDYMSNNVIPPTHVVSMKEGTLSISRINKDLFEGGKSVIINNRIIFKKYGEKYESRRFYARD